MSPQANAIPPLTVQIPAQNLAFKTIDLSANRSPKGSTITADNVSLMLDGKRWMPAMGEFHYARYDEHEWRRELLKMKAGGIDIVSTYVFWIHHEEVEGKWNWTGNHNLRRFLQLCGEVGIKAFVRGGPWVHGESRNGGLPDWLVKNYKTRTDDAAYLAKLQMFYNQIGEQMKGLSWSQGGPVVGFQLENELYCPGEYFDKLKEISVAANINVPLYTRTGWPAPKSAPSQAIFPMFGGYPVGFWDRGTAETARTYGSTFVINKVRNPDQILQGDLVTNAAREQSDLVRYPYLCCEIGGGMAMSYHRRVIVQPDDIGSIAMVKLASGNNLQGYYMYHGGTNPDGQLTYLNETQATNYWNDVPVKGYDFQAPLGEFGQVRDHYHILRRMHMFLSDFGPKLAAMPTYVPDGGPPKSDDNKSVRWSVRSDGHSGVVFVNNYQRLQSMPAKKSVQFELNLPSGKQLVPEKPISIPADDYFYMPFNMDLEGVTLRSATVQPVCRLKNGNETSYFFAEIPGIKPEFSFEQDFPQHFKTSGGMDKKGRIFSTSGFEPGLKSAVSFQVPGGKKVQLFVLTKAQSLHLWKIKLAGMDRIVYTDGNPVFDGDKVTVSDFQFGDLAIYPAPRQLNMNGARVEPTMNGSFAQYTVQTESTSAVVSLAESTKTPGEPRVVLMGSQGVAEQPSDADFEKAGVWKMKFVGLDSSGLVSIAYVGDVARLYVDGKLVLDDFYNGRPLEFNPSQLGIGKNTKEVLLKVLPLRKDAPIYLSPGMTPSFGKKLSVCEVNRIKVVNRSEAVFQVR